MSATHSVTLNGSPLPSPEPLQRVVPLDIIPTSFLSGALVQKTFSPEFSAEFGGGLVELRTKSIPDEFYFKFGASIGFDTQTTGQPGLLTPGGNIDNLWASAERSVASQKLSKPPFSAPKAFSLLIRTPLMLPSVTHRFRPRLWDDLGPNYGFSTEFGWLLRSHI